MKEFITNSMHIATTKLAEFGILTPISETGKVCEWDCNRTGISTHEDGQIYHEYTCNPYNCEKVARIVGYRMTQLGDLDFDNPFEPHIEMLDNMSTMNEVIAKQIEAQIRASYQASQQDFNSILDINQKVYQVVDSTLPSSSTLRSWGCFLGEKLGFIAPEKPPICPWDDYECHQNAISAEFATCNDANRYSCYWDKIKNYLNQYDLNEVCQSACAKYLPEKEDAMLYGAVVVGTTALLLGAYYAYKYKKNQTKLLNEKAPAVDLLGVNGSKSESDLANHSLSSLSLST